MELEALQNELFAARQAQADAEFSRELAGQIVSKIAGAVQGLSVQKLKILQAYILKSLELAGVPEDE